MASNKPKIGDVVHYRTSGKMSVDGKSQLRAAIITEVLSDVSVSLYILTPTNNHWRSNVTYSDAYYPGTWCWPPK